MISPEEIAALAQFYDRYANAFERTSPDRLLARRQFYARLEMLYEREGRVVTYDIFRFEMVKLQRISPQELVDLFLADFNFLLSQFMLFLKWSRSPLNLKTALAR